MNDRKFDTLSLRLGRVVAVLVGQRIRLIREGIGMSRAELGFKAGLTYGSYCNNPKAVGSAIYDIENASMHRTNRNHYGTRLGTLYAIAAALHVDIGRVMPSVDEVTKIAYEECHNAEKAA